MECSDGSESGSYSGGSADFAQGKANRGQPAKPIGSEACTAPFTHRKGVQGVHVTESSTNGWSLQYYVLGWEQVISGLLPQWDALKSHGRLLCHASSGPIADLPPSPSLVRV